MSTEALNVFRWKPIDDKALDGHEIMVAVFNEYYMEDPWSEYKMRFDGNGWEGVDKMSGLWIQPTLYREMAK